MNLYKKLFFTSRFFIINSVIVIVFAISFIFHRLFPVAISLVSVLYAITIADLLLLINKQKRLTVERKVPSLLSLGDKNRILIYLKNNSGLHLKVDLFDDLPYQLQYRDFKLSATIEQGKDITFEYFITPVSRGKYEFGNINLLTSTVLGLTELKFVYPLHLSVPVYPSIIQMKKLELKTNTSFVTSDGIKQRRRIGHSYEFDQIKEYVIGDDSRSINWKASSRKGMLMVNQYEDERSQQIYSIIDKSRTMRLPFNNLTLLDYSINSVLAISNVIMQKHDKAGLITFSDKIGTILPAEKSSQHLKKILEALYNEKENHLEAEYELLFHLVRNIIKNRSLIFLYTNFESYHAFERVLPILRQISKFHLLVIIFFENEEITNFSKQPVNTAQDIYLQTIARKYLHEKNQIVSELSKFGILSIKTAPSELSISVINKYLELKSRGSI